MTEDARIELIVNGDRRSVARGISLSELVTELGFAGQRIAAEVNLDVVPRSEYSTHRLEDGDRIEIVSFVGGG